MTYLKWVGSKAKLLTLIEPYLPRVFNDYYEPFVGSGALFFWYRHRAAWDQDDKQYHISDCNEQLINCHLVVAHHLSELKKKLTEWQSLDSKSFFMEQREKTADKIKMGSDVEAAARFIYLNRRAWGGMWRVNQKGVFNVPFCETQKSSIIPKHLSKCSEELRVAQIRHCDYSEIAPKKGDFVFLDPPYYPLSETSNFTGYTADDWDIKDHESLMKYLKRLDRKGVKFLMTNHDCSFVRSYCEPFRTKSQPVTRYIDAVTHHSKAGKSTKERRDKVNEYFVWNYDENEWS